MRVRIRHGGAVHCDAPKCKRRFTSYSVLMFTRKQAREAGWASVPAWQVHGNSHDYPRRKLDVCPKHAEVAKANKGRRDEIMLAGRVVRKAERAELRAAKLEVKLAERAQAKANREAERSLRQVARAARSLVDRAQRKAARIEAKVRGAKVHVASAAP